MNGHFAFRDVVLLLFLFKASASVEQNMGVLKQSHRSTFFALSLQFCLLHSKTLKETFRARIRTKIKELFPLRFEPGFL